MRFRITQLMIYTKPLEELNDLKYQAPTKNLLKIAENVPNSSDKVRKY